MENLEVIHHLAETQTIADRETLCHNATKAFSLSELESIRLTHFLLIVVVIVVLGWYGSGCKFLFFPMFWPVRVKGGMNLRNDIIMRYA